MLKRPLTIAAHTGGLTLLLALAACGARVNAEPAPDAAHPQCAEVMASVRADAFDTLADRERRSTTAQSTAAWGDPAVILRCGVPAPPPTTDPCVSVDEVDWVLDDSGERPTFITYGRVPALEISFSPADTTGSDAVLVELGPLAELLPQERDCV